MSAFHVQSQLPLIQCHAQEVQHLVSRPNVMFNRPNVRCNQCNVSGVTNPVSNVTDSMSTITGPFQF